MKLRVSAVCGVIAMCGIFSVSAFGQNTVRNVAASDKFVISAKAGGVNYVEGMVAIAPRGRGSRYLVKGDTLQIGERVSTGADGRAEILLNPGSYVRLGPDSTFELRTTALDDLQLRLHRGSAILEVFAGDEFIVTVTAPKAKFRLINSGVFRVDVNADGGGTLSVWKGRAQAGSSKAGIIKAGYAMTLTDSTVSVAKFDRDDRDALELWSKSRGKQLAKLTDSLKKRDMRSALMNSYASNQWDMYGSFGLWVFDRFSGTYCFLPFGYGWSSPYGYGFGRHIGGYDLPSTVYNSPTWPSGGVPNPPSGPPAQPTQTIRTAGDRSPVPPFVRMSGDGRGFNNDGRDPGGSDWTRPAPSTRDTWSAPPSPPVKMESPPPVQVTEKDGE